MSDSHSAPRPARRTDAPRDFRLAPKYVPAHFEYRYEIDPPSKADREAARAAVVDELKTVEKKIETLLAEMKQVSASRTGRVEIETTPEETAAKAAQKEANAALKAANQALDAANEAFEAAKARQTAIRAKVGRYTVDSLEDAIEAANKAYMHASGLAAEREATKVLNDLERLRTAVAGVAEIEAAFTAAKTAQTEARNAQKAAREAAAAARAEVDRFYNEHKALFEAHKAARTEVDAKHDALYAQVKALRTQRNELRAKADAIFTDFQAAYAQWQADRKAAEKAARQAYEEAEAERKAEYEAAKAARETAAKQAEIKAAGVNEHEREAEMIKAVAALLKDEAAAAAAAAAPAVKAGKAKKQNRRKIVDLSVDSEAGWCNLEVASRARELGFELPATIAEVAELTQAMEAKAAKMLAEGKAAADARVAAVKAKHAAAPKDEAKEEAPVAEAVEN